MSTDPGAQDGAVPPAAASPPAFLEQMSQEATVRLAALIEEWRQARAALLGG